MTIMKKKGDHDCLSGDFKGVEFDVFVVKDPNYNMIMMSTYYGLII